MAWTRSDDLDGSVAEQLTFGVGSQAYVIDLGEANKAKLMKALTPFLAVARPYGEMPEVDDYWPSNDVVATPEPTPAPRAEATIAPPVPPRRTRRKQVAKGPAKKAASKPVAAAAQVSNIRDWANANGYSVGPTGRIPKAVLDAYESQTPAS